MKNRGFSLVELMVVIVIIAIVSVVGGLSLSSRVQVAKLEELAKKLSTDLSYARTAARFKGCPVRIIFCGDRNCNDNTVAGANGRVDADTDTPAKFYALIRAEQSSDSTASCYNADAPVASADGFANWSFDRRPQMIDDGLAFSDIYDGDAYTSNGSDLATTSGALDGNSIWFDSTTGAVSVPIAANNNDTEGDQIVFQVHQDNCDPADPSDECPGYIVTIGDGGVTNFRKCSPGGRSNDSNTCF